MKAKKIIESYEDIDLRIEEVTLLSVEEAKEVPKSLLAIGACWWLRSPGYCSSYAAYVYDDGSVDRTGNYVDRIGNYDNHVDDAVRPALRISNLKSKIGDALEIADLRWTAISDTLVLCNEIVGCTCFRSDWDVPNANDFEKSDIKKWLDEWAKEQGIEVEKDADG